jgi:hypothetical protein
MLTWVNNIRAIKEHDTDDRIAASFSSSWESAAASYPLLRHDGFRLSMIREMTLRLI